MKDVSQFNEDCATLYELMPELYDTIQFWRDGEVYTQGEYEDYGMSYNFNKETDTPLYDADFLSKVLPHVIQSDYDRKFLVLSVFFNGDGNIHFAYMEPYDKEDRGEYITNSKDLAHGMVQLLIKLKKDGILDENR